MTMLETSSLISENEEFDLNSSNAWKKLYALLESLARYFVYSSNIPSWRGQEKDVIEDIVQETARRIIERSQKAARGEMPPIQSLRNMLYTVVRNYCTDLCRRDRRLMRIQPQNAAFQAFLKLTNQVDPSEASVENVYLEMLFRLVACEVVSFPAKQRRAILIDIASQMHFDGQPTPLQEAFLSAGIDLREYQQLLPSSPLEKSRHTALVSYAYKRVVSLQQVQKYIALT
jgi:DNA-directed RNA polymerase specialized sigma24 family protein